MGPRRQREEVEEAGSEQEAGAGSRAGDGCGVSVSVAKLEMPACRGQSWGGGVFSRWCRCRHDPQLHLRVHHRLKQKTLKCLEKVGSKGLESSSTNTQPVRGQRNELDSE